MLQVRYINQQMNYTGKWLTVPSITENEAIKELEKKSMPVQMGKEVVE